MTLEQVSNTNETGIKKFLSDSGFYVFEKRLYAAAMRLPLRRVK